MIGGFLFDLLSSFVGWVLGALLETGVDTPSGLVSAVSNVFDAITQINAIFPVDTAFQLAFTYINIWIAYFTFRFGLFIYHQIWGSN